MQIEINGKRNITLDFNAPKKFRLVKDGAEIPYIRTGKNSFRVSKPVDGFVELEEIVEQPRYMQPVQLQPQQMTVINPQDVDRLNEAVRQMALVNPQDVMIINQTAEQLEQNQNFIAQTQKEITDNQVYIDQQQQRLNETALGIQALETDNSQRLDGAENAILNLAGEISNTQNMAVDGMNTALNKIEEQGILLQAEIDTKADKDELESLKKDFEEKSDRISSAMANYSGGTAYDTLPQGGEAGQILAKRTDRQGDYIWIDQTPVIVKSETIPTASEKYKGEVYQYIGETGDYTHGYIYECQQNGTSYNWVRIDVQPNTAVWGQITGTLSDQTDLQEALDDKQDKLSQTQMDAVNSGANQSNIAQITTNQNNITSINDKIPSQATSTNQLADKDFVNSSISTNTANFIGTFASVSDLEAYSGTITNNDYAFVVNRVVTDNGNDWATFTALNAYDKSLLSNFDYAWVINGANFDLYRFDIVNQVWVQRATNIQKSSVTLNSAFNRYKATVNGGTTWSYEYTLNNSSFTAAQWAAINSSITSDKVALITPFTGADGTNAGTTGLVTAPSATDNIKFLKGDGTWGLPTASTAWGNITGTLSNQTDLQNALNAKQDTLVSGTNIKTINGSTILGSGDLSISSRNIGEIVQSTIPLSDAGLHLLDGSLISGSGSYSAFVTYIASLVSSYPDLFETEANWQSSVTTYGVCGKFVYDSTNNTVRLPKITGFTEGTTDVTALGDLIEAGLPNIEGTIGNTIEARSNPTATGALYVTTTSGGGEGNGNYRYFGMGLDASRSSSIYGNSTTVQPQAIKVLYYIVIANSVKTNIEVDIDEVMTDLNGKADVDLSNVKASGTSLASGWSMPSSRYINLTLGASGTTYTAPANGWFAISKTANSSSNWMVLSDDNNGQGFQCSANANNTVLRVTIPIRKGDTCIVYYFAGGATNYFRFIYAEGENV